MEMDLGSSGRRLRPRRSSPERDGDNGEGRIGALPDALLVLVLSWLGSTAEVARTSLVSPRWRSLWPELPVLVFRGIGPDTLADLLAKARHPNLSRLELQIPRQDPGVPASRISSLLRAADEHNPEEVVFNVGGSDDDGVPFELPFFARATSIDLRIWNRRFVLPPAGVFSTLEKLSLSLCRVEPSEFLPRCPCLRVLDVDCYWLKGDVDVRSDSLEELVLRDVPNRDAVYRMQRRVYIVAPRLKKFKLQSYGHAEMKASFSAPAPMMETLSLRYCSIFSRGVGFTRHWRLMGLNTTMEWWGRDGQLSNPVRVRVLSLVIVYHTNYHAVDRTFGEEILRLPVNNFSILKLELRSMWHVFGEVVFDLLKTLNAIQRLELVLPQTMDHVWTPRRRFHYNPDGWTNEHILLPHLEELEIERFHVIDHDIDMVKLLFTSAPELKTVRIQLFASVSQSDPGYKELCSVFWKNTSAKCYVNGRLEEPEEN
ncbi:uncharacterized protein [Setaria viridis]|uniref:uncharacterized protein n=1 Tax=Setaria viridis TaxID=4556 RepID=UPI003B3BD555